MAQHAVSTLHPSTGTPPTPTPQPHQTSQRVSKAILKTAIQKANSAVVLDKANDLTGAIDAYTEAVNLLDRVLSSETRESDRQRLQETYDKYLKRIQYLNTLKSDADDLYETFENGAKRDEDKAKAITLPSNTVKLQQQPQGKGRYDSWVRKMASSSSLDSKASGRLDMDDLASSSATRFGTRMSAGSVTNTTRFQQRQQSGMNTTSSTAITTPTSPSSSILMPLDVPPSPVSSKSTPSKSSSSAHRRSNDTINTVSEHAPPPLEPRSVRRPTPRKSSRTGAAAALQQAPASVTLTVAAPPSKTDTPATAMATAPAAVADQQQRRSSISSLSSSSSADSDIICVSSHQQPAMTLPSLLHTKMEATETPSAPLLSSPSSSTVTDPDPDFPANRTSSDSSYNDSSQNESLKLTSTSTSTSTSSSLIMEDHSPSSGGLGRLRTSSLPRKLHFTRPVMGSAARVQRLATNGSTIDDVPVINTANTAMTTRRNVTQSNTSVPEPESPASRMPVQRQSSGLSMRKKYNRLSRSSMDGVSISANGGGRKDRNGPIFSTLFGNVGGNGSTPSSSSSSNRSTEETLNYFGQDNQTDIMTMTAKNGGMTCLDELNATGSPLQYEAYQQGQESSDGSPITNRYLDTHLKLIIALEHSMNYGGYITPKLFIPKNLWHQSNIRLSSMDVKVAACESLILDLNRIEKWRNLDDIRGSLRLIESLEEVVDGLQVTLSKKLKRDSLADTNDDTSSVLYSPDGGNQHSSVTTNNGSNNGGNSGSNGHYVNGHLSNGNGSFNKRTQFMSWGSKLSKSVERMNAFSLTKVEDQHRHYIEVLQKLFIKLHMLEMWFQHYLKKDRQKNPHYDALLTKLGKVCDGINRVVGGFVLRDVAVLLGKWLKRGGIWVNE